LFVRFAESGVCVSGESSIGQRRGFGSHIAGFGSGAAAGADGGGEVESANLSTLLLGSERNSRHADSPDY
jgi:hypothetical protein